MFAYTDTLSLKTFAIAKTQKVSLIREKNKKIYFQIGRYIINIFKVLVTQSCPTFSTPWTVTHQALLSMEFFRQEH